MKEYFNQNYDQERAFYGQKDIFVHHCRFAGPADGESAFKECEKVRVEECEFDLRYPFWHVHDLKMNECELKETCRAALWYSDGITIRNSTLHGIKAFRECHNARIEDSTIRSAEFGWMSSGTLMQNVTVPAGSSKQSSDRLQRRPSLLCVKKGIILSANRNRRLSA